MDTDSEALFTEIEHEKPIVLIADDNEPTLELLREYFDTANKKEHLVCDVISARDGQEAIEQIDLWYPEIIICDVQMPKKSGFAVFDYFCDWRQKQNPYCFFCLLTNIEDEKAHAFRKGVDGFLVKKELNYFPFTLHLKSWLRLVAFVRKYGEP